MAGCSDAVSSSGADDDFGYARYLLEYWEIGTETEWKEKSVALMREPRNIAAVARVAEELELERRLVMDLVETLIAIADGEASEADYLSQKQFIAQCKNNL